MMRRWLLLFLLCAAPLPALADDMVADLSAHVIRVTTGFTGATLIVFGSMEVPADVAIVVEGPLAQATVRQKSRPFGIWLNTDSFVFDNVPGYYAVVSSKPASQLVTPYIIDANGLSLDTIHFGTPECVDAATAELFRKALIERRMARGLYREIPAGAHILSGRLFRAAVPLPANVPIGIYTVHIYLLHEGKVLASQTMSMSVDEIGFSAAVHQAAEFSPFFYAIATLAMALVMGGGGAWLFHKMGEG